MRVVCVGGVGECLYLHGRRGGSPEAPLAVAGGKYAGLVRVGGEYLRPEELRELGERLIRCAGTGSLRLESDS